MNESVWNELREAVLGAGIDMVGVTSAEPLPVLRPEVYAHNQPRSVLSDAKAVIVAGFSVLYEPRIVPSERGAPRGRFTPYGSRAYVQMCDHAERVIGEFLRARGWSVVRAPRIPEKPAAVRAGIGRYGKHGVVLTPELGAWSMFACFVTDAPLPVSNADVLEPAPCPPKCQACRKACPTGAINANYEVDRSRCITNWLWGYPAPAPLRAKQEDRLFGCGECVAACPLSAQVRPRATYPVEIDTRSDSPELIPLLTMDEDHFRRTVPTFTQQAGPDAIRGNAIIALGNIGDPAAVPALGESLRRATPQNRAYAAWALGRIGGAEARELLLAAVREGERSAAVREEIASALEMMV